MFDFLMITIVIYFVKLDGDCAFNRDATSTIYYFVCQCLGCRCLLGAIQSCLRELITQRDVLCVRMCLSLT